MSDLIEVVVPTTPHDPVPAGHGAPASAGFKLNRRFDRAARLLGERGLERLGEARVVVFGLGGVGSYAAEGLVRSGVGRLTLVDFDDVCVTNVNRQLHAMKGTVGKSKAALMAERCRLINPDARIEPVQAFYSADTSATLLPIDAPPTFVVDCIDNVKAKLHLLATCVQRGIPVVSSMGAAGRLDPTMVRLAELCETHNDPFAKDIRKLLRLKYGIETGVPCGIRVVFSPERRSNPEPISYDHGTGFLCVCPSKENDFHTCDHRTRIDGTAGFVTSVFGMVAASHVVRTISGR
jgi:tRNA A37 threonylcarbamoyladenosine dehydratase